jgi:HEAT repeat protein
MGLFGPPDVKNLEAKRDVGGLIRALNYQKDSTIPVHSTVRKAAAEALGKIGDARAVEPLIAALRDIDCDVHWRSADALGQIGDARAVKPLIATLKSPYGIVFQAAARALLQIKTPAVEPLISALSDISSMAVAAAQLLGRIGDARAVEPLIAALRDSNSDVRHYAAEALGKIGGAQTVEKLVTALKNKEEYVRQGAAEALGMIGDARAVEPLIAALDEESQFMRRIAAKVLGDIGDTRAVEPLLSALQDSDCKVRELAATALNKLGWKPASHEHTAWYLGAKREWEDCMKLGEYAVEPFIIALKEDNLELYERCRVAKALGEIGDTRAVEPLISVLPVIREEAAMALVEIYRSGKIGAKDKQAILAKQNEIIEISKHVDEKDGNVECWEHDDRAGFHADFSL